MRDERPGRGPVNDGRTPRVSLERALSKLGVCSRSQAGAVIGAGRVRVDGVVRRDPAFRVDLDRDRIVVDDAARIEEPGVYLALNKPRGLVTAREDAEHRTVYECLVDPSLPVLSPVGRLDKASEGLLLFTNDTRWAARILDPAAHVDKTYHVQVNRVADAALLAALHEGVEDRGERLAVKSARLLRHGGRNSWIEIVLDEGRNRHIRRLLAALGVETLRLVRVAIGPLALGKLARGTTRLLTAEEVRALAAPGRPAV